MSGIDLSKAKSKFTQLTSKAKTTNLLFKPKPGTHTVRIVPYQHNPSWPFIELYHYYNFREYTSNNKILTSPYSYSKSDPIKDFCNSLKNSGDKDDYFRSKSLEPTLRTYVPIIVRGHEDQGVQFWGFGQTIYKQLLELINNPDYGDISNIKTGTDLTLNIEPGGSGGKQYPTTTIIPNRKESPLTTDSTLLKEILENQPEKEELFPPASQEELEKILELIQNNGIKEQSLPYNQMRASYQNNEDVNTNSNKTPELTDETKEKVNSFKTLLQG